MATIKFGAKQIANPTPASVNVWVRVFTIVAGIFMGWMQTNDIIPAHAQGVISAILGLFLAIINGVAPLFGVPITGKVDAEDVAAISLPATAAPNDQELQNKKP